jgi:PKD repeat protein
MKRFYQLVVFFVLFFSGGTYQVNAQEVSNTKGSQTVFPWIEDFEDGGSMPASWSQQYVSGDNLDWDFQNSDSHSSSYAAKLSDAYDSNDDETKLITLELDLTGYTTFTLSFWHKQRERNLLWLHFQDKLKVYYRTSATGQWNLLSQYSDNISNWTQETLNLPSPSSTYYLAFEANAKGGRGVLLDDVRIDASNTPPTADFFADKTSVATLDVVSFTDNSVATPVSWAWTISPSSYSFVNGTSANSQNPQVNFYSAGVYTVGLSVTNSLGSDNITKTDYIEASNCTVDAFPYSEDFENAGNFPNCWYQSYVSGDNLDWSMLSGNGSSNPSGAHSGTYDACLKDTDILDVSSDKTNLCMPPFDFSAFSGASLSFWHTQEERSSFFGTYQDELRVLYKSAPLDDWQVLASFTASINSWTQETITLPDISATYFIAFEGNGKYGYGVCIDDVVVDATNDPPLADFVADNLVPGTGEVVQFTDLSTGYPGMWSWNISPATYSFVNGTNEHSANPEVVFTDNGQYTVSLTAGNNAGSDTETKVNYINASCQYCSSGFSNTSDDYISHVLFNTIDNVSGSVGYEDFTALSTTIHAGASYNLSVEITVNGNWEQHCIAWIDWNHDCDFDEFNEAFDLGNTDGSSGTHLLNVAVSVPSTALSGSTRMRIIELYNSNPNPCQTGIYGETEDYTVIVPPQSLSWVGLVSGDWNQAANWDKNYVPDREIDVIVDEGVYYNPVLSGHLYVNHTGGAYQCKSLTINSGGVLRLNAPNDAQVYGDVTINTDGHFLVGDDVNFRNNSHLYLLGGELRNFDLSNHYGGVFFRSGSGGYMSGGLLTAFQRLVFRNSSWDAFGGELHLAGTDTVTMVVRVQTPDIAHLVIQSGSVGVLGGSTNVPLEVNMLNVQPQAGLSIESSKEMNILDDAVFEADSTGIASFINRGSYSVLGSLDFQQYLTSDQWHQVSAPVDTATNDCYMGTYFYSWSEPDSAYVNHNELGYPMEIAKGYFVWASTQAKTIHFIGNTNSGDPTLSLDFTPSAYSSPNAAGHNLVGNPFPSYLVYNNNWTLNNVDATIYIWDNNTGQYAYMNPNLSIYDSIIPPTQGFYMNANAANAYVVIPEANQTHQKNVSFYKNRQNGDFLTLKIEGNNYSDRVFIAVREDATDGFDSQYDAYDMRGRVEAPQMFIVDNNIQYSIDVLPKIDKHSVFPIGIEVGDKGVYSISMPKTDFASQFEEIYLVDLLLNKKIDIAAGQSYVFEASPNDPANRFELRFASPMQIVEQTTDILIYASQQNLIITGASEGDYVTIYDLLGHIVLRQRLNAREVQIPLPLANAHYIVNLFHNKYLFHKKVFIY